MSKVKVQIRYSLSVDLAITLVQIISAYSHYLMSCINVTLNIINIDLCSYVIKGAPLISTSTSLPLLILIPGLLAHDPAFVMNILHFHSAVQGNPCFHSASFITWATNPSTDGKDQKIGKRAHLNGAGHFIFQF